MGKPGVITCYAVPTAQLHQVTECTHHVTGVDSVVFNTRVDNMQSDSNQSGYHSYAGDPTVPGASGTTMLNKIPGIPCFSGTEQEKGTVHLNSGYILFQMLEKL